MKKEQNRENNNATNLLENYECDGQLRFVGVELHIEEEKTKHKNSF